MLRGLRAAGLVLAGIGCSLAATATSVTYDVTHISGQEWEYSYDVTNNSLAVAISELTFYFNPAAIGNVAIGPSQPAAWSNPIAVQADPAFLPALSGYGYFDTVASDSGIAAGSTLTGFTVLVEYTGSGTPGSQTFQVVDPTSFNTLDQGQTQPTSVTSVPEPESILLLSVGLATIGFAKRRRTAPENENGIIPASVV